MDDDLKYIITEEDRTRHDVLFYSQNPKNGLLSGEQARSLFIRSRLPLSELSKIWKLADLTRDNMLDVSEFATAMHLIQLRLRGFDVPDKLPPTLTPTKVFTTDIPKITEQELEIYQQTFEWKDKGKTGYIDTETACNIMLSSKLESYMLALIWDLSDMDRDAKLSNAEFAIALHLLRFCKRGNKLEGSINVKAALPQELVKDDGEAKKKRHTEVQTERRQLWTLKQKLCSEMAGLADEKLVDEKIRPELNSVEERLSVLEKEETELRRSLLNLKDKSKKESFKPFDRSFLLKKRISGSDLFKGDRQSYLSSDDSKVFQKLWSADPDKLLDENEFNIRKHDNSRTSNYKALDENFSQNRPQDIIFTEVKGNNKEVSGLANGVDSIDSSIQSGYTLNEKSKRNVIQENKVTEKHEGKKVDRNESFSWAAVQRRPVISQTVNEEIFAMPEKKADVVEEFVSMEHKERGSNVDEQLKLLENSSSHVDINHNARDEQVTVSSSKTLQSANGDIDDVFNKISDDHSTVNGNRVNNKLPVGRVLSIEEEKGLIESGALKRAEREFRSRSEPSQEELLPLFLEEKRKAEEERRKKREAEEEKIRQAREEIRRQDEENRQQLLMRKAAIQEARGKLEKQISQSEEAAPKTNAGRLIEKELEEQRIRDEEARLRMEQLHRESIDRPKPESKEGKTQPKHVVIDSSPVEKKAQSYPPVVRRQKPEQSARNQSNRKSWVELEIEQQKRKDEEMRLEREERQRDLNRLAEGQKQLHAIKRDIEISDETHIHRTAERPLESQPRVSVMQTSELFSKPPARNAVPATSREVAKPSKTPYGSSVNRGIPAKESVHSISSANIDSVDASKTPDADEMERRIQEEEEKRRLEQIEKIRQDSLKREAEELVRKRDIREEEIRKKKEEHLKETQKIKKDELERLKEAKANAEHRRLAFEVEKVRLEERVIRTMKEAQSESSNRTRTPSTSSESSVHRVSSPTVFSDEEEARECPSVRDAKALFERPQENKVLLRQKRQSYNMDDSATLNKPSRNSNRASFYSDAIVSKEMKKTNAIQIIGLHDPVPEEKPSRLVLGDIASRRHQFETRQSSTDDKPVTGKSERPQSLVSTTISNSKIQQEMEELQRKEEEIRLRREFVNRRPLEQNSVDGASKKPLPSQMQVKRAAPTAPMQGHQQNSAPVKKTEKKMSFIEMEKEKERQREEALQIERQKIMKEREMLLQHKELDQPKEPAKKKSVTGGWQYK